MTQLATQQGSKSIMDLITARRSSLEAVANKHLTTEKLIKFVGVAVSKSPKLRECTPMSVLECVMTAAQLGLDPSGVLGSAYLVPFKQQCTLIIGYRGLIDLCRRSGDVVSVQARLVYRADEFECQLGSDEPRITHKPNLQADREDKDIIGAYAVALLTGGVRQFDWMSRKEIEKIRSRSRASGAGPWVTDFGEMCKKTVIRRLVKSLPLTTETAHEIETITKVDPTMAVIDFDGQSEPADDPPAQGNKGLAAALGAPSTTDDAAEQLDAVMSKAAPNPPPKRGGFDENGNPIDADPDPPETPAQVGTVDRATPKGGTRRRS